MYVFLRRNPERYKIPTDIFPTTLIPTDVIPTMFFRKGSYPKQQIPDYLAFSLQVQEIQTSKERLPD